MGCERCLYGAEPRFQALCTKSGHGEVVGTPSNKTRSRRGFAVRKRSTAALATSTSIPGLANGSARTDVRDVSSRNSWIPPGPRMEKKGAMPTRSSPSRTATRRRLAPFGRALRHHASIHAGEQKGLLEASASPSQASWIASASATSSISRAVAMTSPSVGTDRLSNVHTACLARPASSALLPS